MTLPRVNAITGAWANSPPAHWSLSALAGFKPKEKAVKEQDLREMFGVSEVARG
jgi:hypothetical protein